MNISQFFGNPVIKIGLVTLAPATRLLCFLIEQ